MPAAVIERLLAYGISNATADIKQHVPHLQSVAALALPWKPLPAYHFQLKTGECCAVCLCLGLCVCVTGTVPLLHLPFLPQTLLSSAAAVQPLLWC